MMEEEDCLCERVFLSERGNPHPENQLRPLLSRLPRPRSAAGLEREAAGSSRSDLFGTMTDPGPGLRTYHQSEDLHNK